MGLAFWRNYHEQQAAKRAAAQSPLEALETPKNPRTAKPERKAVEAVAAPPPPPPPKPEPKPEPKKATMSQKERVIQKIRSRTETSRSS